MEKLDQTFDPLTGLQTTSWFDHEGQLHVNYQQDIEPHAEAVIRTRNDGDAWRKGVKDSMVHALHIPDVHLISLHKMKINPYTAPLSDIVAALKKLGVYEQCDMTGKQLFRRGQ